MINPDLTYYNVFLANMSSAQYENQPPTIYPEVTLTFKTSAAGASSNPELFMKDAEVMNKVRLSKDPAVTEAYEQLLTVMALTSGRKIEAK